MIIEVTKALEKNHTSKTVMRVFVSNIVWGPRDQWLRWINPSKAFLEEPEGEMYDYFLCLTATHLSLLNISEILMCDTRENFLCLGKELNYRLRTRNAK